MRDPTAGQVERVMLWIVWAVLLNLGSHVHIVYTTGVFHFQCCGSNISTEEESY